MTNIPEQFSEFIFVIKQNNNNKKNISIHLASESDLLSLLPYLP